jgi:hypothetical protein
VIRLGFRMRRLSRWTKDSIILIGGMVLITAGALWWGSCLNWWGDQYIKRLKESGVHLCNPPSMIIGAIHEVKHVTE